MVYLTKTLWGIRNINMLANAIVLTIILMTQTLALNNWPHWIRFVTGQVRWTVNWFTYCYWIDQCFQILCRQNKISFLHLDHEKIHYYALLLRIWNAFLFSKFVTNDCSSLRKSSKRVAISRTGKMSATKYETLSRIWNVWSTCRSAFESNSFVPDNFPKGLIINFKRSLMI